MINNESETLQGDLGGHPNGLEGHAKDIKVVIVGDGAVGKTCLCNVFVKREFPEEYEATVFENYSQKMEVEGQVR